MNFGSAFVGVAAGAVPPPPPPPPLSVVVVEVDVSVDVVSVVESDEVESGVVVVIVVTTVVLPVVIVVTIVVVASAWKGAAPAVNAAVAAPRVISTANAAPQTAYFLYCLLIPPPCPWTTRRPTQLADTYSRLIGTRGSMKPGSGFPSCSTGSRYVRDQATRPAWTPKMITPRSSSIAPLRAVP